jgi:signal transduction histidine kinase
VIGDRMEIILVAAACATGVGVLGLGVAWSIQRRSIRWLLALVVVVATGGALAGVLVVAQLLFISRGDREVVLLVTGVAGAVALVVALVVGAFIGHWSEGLRHQVCQLDAQAFRVGAGRGPGELRSMAEELARTSARLEEDRLRQVRLESSRRHMMSMVTHDLRAPLAGMRAMTEALADGMAADPARYYSQIRTGVDRMARMVDDLFELSQLQEGVLPISPESVALEAVVTEAVAEAHDLAMSRGIRLGGTVEDRIEVTADPSALSRVVSNLIMNAIRHTPADGAVLVRGRAVPEGVEVSVTDQCGGLPEDDMRRVFDLAWRGEEGPAPLIAPTIASDSPSGRRAGLGLAIVKGIVEAHRGVVRVENVTTEGHPTGCRFLVKLPA